MSSNRQLNAFYAARSFRPIWFAGGRPTHAAHRFVQLLETADIDGLDPKEYRAERLRELIETAPAAGSQQLAETDAALSKALLAYAEDLRRKTKSDLTYVDKSLRPTRPSAITLLQAAGAAASIEDVVQMHPLYMQLRAGYGAWRSRWSGLPQITIPTGPPIATGARGERVRLLRERLGLAAGSSFDPKLAAEIKAFKQAHGLPSTGVVDAQTLAALNEQRSVTDSRIRLNLARARALPAPGMGRHLVVDAAGQRLLFYEGSRLVDSMDVIVGKPSEPTPMLAAYIRYTAVNPYWNVPPDLVASRVAENVLSQGLGYLNAKGYQVLSGWSADAQPLDPATVDWQAAAAGRLQLPVRQLPGPGNMMGAMKFMFPNKFGVYLHDTPEKVLFKETDRRRSSGCVRLQDAPRLARWLYGRVPTAPSGSAEFAVPLPKPVPVFITYLTAAPAAGGGVAFRQDVYGRDRLSRTKLASAF